MNMKSLLMSFFITLPALLLNPVLANQNTTAAVKTPMGETVSKNKLSINTATVEQLEALEKLYGIENGIGSKLAAKIADFVSF